jgi:hypothetical protein
MQARMKNPARVVPAAMQALLALGKSAHNRSVFIVTTKQSQTS